ncbi:MAG: rhodanese-like protein [Segetibacter sp.]|nr:rhodanese-like protein [Segetibacter sp.]
MIKTKLLFAALALFSVTAKAQHPFKYDNTIYKAVYLNEAFRLMDSSQKYLLLDVRSPGEYADTAQHTAMNIGRIKGAVNIDIDSVPAHLPELKKYMNEPVFIYCSHSQRSRRVSKLLADNGFQKVYNINGGMTLVNETDAGRFPYKSKVLVTNTFYKNIASADALNLVKNTPDLVIIDIRTEREFASRDSLQRNNIGRFSNAINIPQEVFAEKFDSYKILNNKPVLLYDLDGYNSMDVVDILRSKGFTQIYNLFEGLSAFSCDHAVNRDLRNQLLTNAPVYKMLDTEAGIDLLKQNANLVILDVRPIDEYENKSAKTYLNLGRIKGAVHIPSLGSLEKFIQEKDRSAQFLVYGSGSDFGNVVCQTLVKKGFRYVNLLSQGLYRFVWSTANIEDCQHGKSFLINHEGLY